MANYRNRCPRCGRPIKRNAQDARNRQNTATDGECGGATVTAAANGGCTSPSLAAELYGVADCPVVLRTCCDPRNGCVEFDGARRNSFWPNFCHPRWLSCDQLYTCG